MSFMSLSRTTDHGLIPSSVYQTRDEACTKTVVDIHYRHIRSTRVEHAEQRRQTIKRSSVPDPGGHCYDGNRNQSADNRRQRAFHPGDNNDHSSRFEIWPSSEQPVNAGHANVVDARHPVAHRGGGNGGFFRDRNIGCSRGDDGDDTIATFGSISLDRDHSSLPMKLRV